MPARVSGFTYVMYWAYATPPTAVRLAESIVIPILNRVTWMPTDAAAVSSSPIASIAARAIDRSTRYQIQSPASQRTSEA